jgi:ABC-type transporter Mla MlaB component
MLRITRSQDRTLRLEGRLTRYEVGLLGETLRASPNDYAAIDLTELVSIDEAGAATLLDLERHGLELRGASPFVREFLQEVFA